MEGLVFLIGALDGQLPSLAASQSVSAPGGAAVARVVGIGPVVARLPGVPLVPVGTVVAGDPAVWGLLGAGFTSSGVRARPSGDVVP